jgi:hypothetical protein
VVSLAYREEVDVDGDMTKLLDVMPLDQNNREPKGNLSDDVNDPLPCKNMCLID